MKVIQGGASVPAHGFIGRRGAQRDQQSQDEGRSGADRLFLALCLCGSGLYAQSGEGGSAAGDETAPGGSSGTGDHRQFRKCQRLCSQRSCTCGTCLSGGCGASRAGSAGRAGRFDRRHRRGTPDRSHRGSHPFHSAVEGKQRSLRQSDPDDRHEGKGGSPFHVDGRGRNDLSRWAASPKAAGMIHPNMGTMLAVHDDGLCHRCAQLLQTVLVPSRRRPPSTGSASTGILRPTICAS